MKVLAIIPVYNEEKTVFSVVKDIKNNFPQIDVIVVNDGSTDNTYDSAVSSGAVVLDLPFNLGIGGAMQTGYLFAWKNNYDIAIQVDGDGQHDCLYMEKLMEPLMNGQADMVIGSRYVAKSLYKASVCRRMGMVFFSSMVRILTGEKIKDTTSGFRAVNRKIIKLFALKYPSDYPEVNVLVKLHRYGLKIIEYPVEMKQRSYRKSSITPMRSAYYLFKVSLAMFMDVIRSTNIW